MHTNDFTKPAFSKYDCLGFWRGVKVKKLCNFVSRALPLEIGRGNELGNCGK